MVCHLLAQQSNPVILITGKKEIILLINFGFNSSSFSSYLDTNTGEYRVENFKKQEKAYIESVRLLGNDDGNEQINKVAIMMAFQVNFLLR
jgi:hypothetical protein